MISIYGPTYQRSELEKDGFWDSLTAACTTNNNTKPIVIGDFNARPGTCERPGSSMSAVYPGQENNYRTAVKTYVVFSAIKTLLGSSVAFRVTLS